MLFRTPLGLRLRSVGEHPKAADTVGINVYAIRYGAVVASGVLAALGGAFLSVGFVGSFAENMTAGEASSRSPRSSSASGGRPGRSPPRCSSASASPSRIPLQREADVSAFLISTLPYVFTLIALVGLIGRSVPPAADGKPYIKG